MPIEVSAGAIRLQRNYTAHLEKCEEAFRSVLAQYIPPMEERILSYRMRDGRDRETHRYSEIDFVGLVQGQPAVFAEVKFKERHAPGRRYGYGQLRRSLEIARCRWKDLRGLCLNIYMGQAYQLATHAPCELKPLSDMVDWADPNDSDNGICFLWLSGMEFMRHSVANNIMGEEDWEMLRKARMVANDPLSSYGKPVEEKLSSIGEFLDL